MNAGAPPTRTNADAQSVDFKNSPGGKIRRIAAAKIETHRRSYDASIASSTGGE